MKKLLTFLTLLTLSIGVSWAADKIITLDFETNSIPTEWTNSNFVVVNNVGTNSSATNGSYCGSTGGKTKSTLAYGSLITSVKSISVDAARTSNNTNTTLYIQYSTDNTNWVDAKQITNIPKNSWATTTYTFETPTDCYVRICWDGTTATKFIDNFVITYEEGGTQPTTVTQPTITLDPASVPYYEGDEVTATLACETQGATIYYKLNDDATWTEYSEPLTLNQTTTIHAKAVLGTNESSEKIELVSFGKSASTVAEILALENNDYFKFRGNLVVSGKGGSQLYAQDGTGGVHFYAPSAPSYTRGQIIPAGFVARYVKNYNNTGAPELDNVSGLQESTETGSITAEELTPDEITADNPFIYAVINDATVSGTTITANGKTVALYNNYFNVTIPNDGKTYNIYGITSYYNNPQFLPLEFKEVTVDPGDGYYLVGTFNMDGDNWVAKDARYKFSGEGTTLTLNNVNLPDNVQFKIVKWEGSSKTWYGGKTDDTNQQNTYGLHKDWHTNIPLTNSYNNDYVKNFSIAAGAVSNFTLNTNNMTFDVQRDEQLYVKGNFNDWNKTAMNSISTGWTINQAISAEDEFGFVDEWGDWHGGNGYRIYQEEHEVFGETKPSDIGQELDITSSDNFYMVTAGTYTLNVNSNLTKLVVYVPLAINCTATSDVEGKAGGTVTAKVNDNNATVATTGETVNLVINPWSGYTLDNVTLNGVALTEGENGYSFEMPNVAANVVANFKVNYYDITVSHINGTGTESELPQTAYTGQKVTFSVTPDEGFEVVKVSYKFNNGAPVTIVKNADTNDYTFNMPAFPVTIIVTYSQEGGSTSTGDWVLVKDDSQLIVGNEYIIVNQEYGKAMSTTQNANNRAAVDIEFSTDFETVTTPNDNMQIFTLQDAGVDDEYDQMYYFYANHGLFMGYIFAAGTGDSNYLRTEETPNNKAMAKISFDDNVANIIFSKAGTKRNWIRYNSATNNGNIFSCYGSGQNPVYLYTRGVEAPVEYIDLAGICKTGVEGNNYMITDQLLAVEYGESEEGEGDEMVGYSYLWCKDLGNKSIFATSIHEGDQIDFMMDNGTQATNWDQSNWIALRFKNPTQSEGSALRNAVGRYINAQTIKGVLVDDNNYMLEVADNTISTTACDVPYKKNTYCTSNFVLENLNIFGTIDSGDGGFTTGNDQNYFFMNPKVQEACVITFAKWDAELGYFTVPNNSGFEGVLNVDLTYNTNPNLDLSEALTDQKVYQFNAIVKRSSKNAYMKANESPISVYPTDLDGSNGNNPPTAINTISVNGQVKSVKYVNVAGMVSDVPFQGVNIVVTEYSDGSRSTSKMLRK